MLKICGMTRVGDALHAVREGATAIGFVFWKGSPRYIEPDRAGEIAAALPTTVTTVGVFVNEPVDAIRQTARVAGLRMVQLHGEETAAFVQQLEQPVMRAVTLDTLVETTKTWPADTTLLLDSTDPSRRGAGRAAVDWPRAAVITRGRRVILAGGLTPDNIAEAIVTVRPIGVDVASGVESAPGVKDLDKVARFLANAQSAFARMVNP
ncbi:MAG TPA: phosphoribosylanthranilate isomerase [Vicinamibacterales bacterium]|nr:phosphoribosylanthranilate isomerase [Vicinamibacterales bacterium]